MKRAIIFGIVLILATFTVSALYDGSIGSEDFWYALNESSGSTADDVTNNHDGSLSNMESSDWTDGVWGNALTFDGINESVSISSSYTQPKTITLWFRTSHTSQQGIFGHNDKYFALSMDSDGKLRFRTGAGATINLVSSNTYQNGTWFFVAASESGTNTSMSIWYEGEKVEFFSTTHGNGGLGPTSHHIGKANIEDTTKYFNGTIEDVVMFEKVLSDSEITSLANFTTFDGNDSAPQVLDPVNCKSCGPNGSTTEPFVTSDTTPTFNFTTDLNANCRIGNTNVNHSVMEETRDCSSGQGTKIHTCTLTSQDELTETNTFVYISCENFATGSQTLTATKTLNMSITGLEANASLAIDRGIQSSEVWPLATVYNNQQVFLRNIQGDEKLTTVDRVVVSGNERWLINYESDGTGIGLFNISPVVYTLDMVNKTVLQIEQRVSGFINTTY